MSINVNKKTVYIAVSRTKQSYSRFDLQLYDKAAENFAYLTVNNKRKLVISYICIAVYEYRIPAAKISYKPCRRINGHTPFSAIVAFLSLYCTYLIGGEYIVLSNESSANSGNIEGREVNHQYSKSYRFENDFTEYVGENLLSGIRYFSLLRPFSELQIAKQFALLPQYHKVFRSCNRGSKKNIWCC